MPRCIVYVSIIIMLSKRALGQYNNVYVTQQPIAFTSTELDEFGLHNNLLQNNSSDPVNNDTIRNVSLCWGHIQTLGCQNEFVHGYNYKIMHPINKIFFDNTFVKRDRKGSLLRFYMYGAVMAPKDGLILLSPTANPDHNDLVFEIGMGIAANNFTIVRLMKDSTAEVARASTPGVLKNDGFRPFYIFIKNDALHFGFNRKQLIVYEDTRVRTIKYFGVSSWGDSDAHFLYDCPRILTKRNDGYILD